MVSYKINHGDELVKWGFLHSMYAYDYRTPYNYIEKMNEYQIFNIADRISQDVLILGATKDHFIDYHMVGSEINALACDTMLNWIAFMTGAAHNRVLTVSSLFFYKLVTET